MSDILMISLVLRVNTIALERCLLALYATAEPYRRISTHFTAQVEVSWGEQVQRRNLFLLPFFVANIDTLQKWDKKQLINQKIITSFI